MSPDDSPDEDESQTSDSGFSECSSIDSSEDRPPGMSGLTNIPDGVFVVCDHFLQYNHRQPKSVHAEVKTCESCEQRSKLKYATWNSNRYHWQVMRPCPVDRVPQRAVFKVCWHFASDRPCTKELCTFPHGEQEKIIWTLEREGRKCTDSSTSPENR